MFARAVASLRRRGVGRAAAEDAAQEAGARAISNEVAFTDADDLLRWIQTVSWRIVLDSRKHDRRLVYEVPDEESREDVGGAVESRLRLERLGVLLRSLSPAEHAALVEHGRGTDRRTSTRIAVRKHRLRVKLIAMLDGAALLVALLRRRFGRVAGGRRFAAIAAPLLVTATWLVPGALHQNRPVAGPVTSRAPVSPAGAAASDASTGPVASSPVEPLAPSPRSEPLPSLEIYQPDAAGGTRVWTRPKQPDDHFVCLSLTALPSGCFDLPVKVTD